MKNILNMSDDERKMYIRQKAINRVKDKINYIKNLRGVNTYGK